MTNMYNCRQDVLQSNQSTEQTLVQLHVNISTTHIYLMMPIHIVCVALYSTDCKCPYLILLKDFSEYDFLLI